VNRTPLRAAVAGWSAKHAARYAEPHPAPSLPSLEALLATTAEAFDHDLLRADPLFGRLPHEAATRAIAVARADGLRHAAACGSPADARTIARQLGLTVTEALDGNRFGSVFQFAEYRSRPPTITIYRAAMDLLRDTIRRHALAPVLGMADPEPLYVAHELYHHLDAAQPAPVARSTLVTTVAIGPLRLRSGLVSLPEIAAAAFAAAMTGCRCHPRVLDGLARHALSQA
jgi:hypothetical protein